MLIVCTCTPFQQPTGPLNHFLKWCQSLLDDCLALRLRLSGYVLLQSFLFLSITQHIKHICNPAISGLKSFTFKFEFSILHILAFLLFLASFPVILSYSLFFSYTKLPSFVGNRPCFLTPPNFWPYCSPRLECPSFCLWGTSASFVYISRLNSSITPFGRPPWAVHIELNAPSDTFSHSTLCVHPNPLKPNWNQWHSSCPFYTIILSPQNPTQQLAHSGYLNEWETEWTEEWINECCYLLQVAPPYLGCSPEGWVRPGSPSSVCLLSALLNPPDPSGSSCNHVPCPAWVLPTWFFFQTSVSQSVVHNNF